MTIVYILLGILIFLTLATHKALSQSLMKIGKLEERLEDIEDVLAEVKANTDPEPEEDPILSHPWGRIPEGD